MKLFRPLLSLYSFLLVTHSAFAQTSANPSNPGATVVDRNQLQITWQDNSNNEDGFAVFTYANGSTQGYLGSVAANSTSALISGLPGGQSVQYAIYAYIGNSVSSQGIITPLVMIPDVLTRYGHEATDGEAFSAELYTDDSDLQTSASVTGMPAGATFDAATRTFAFTPTEPGSFTLNVQVTYSYGFTLNETVPIRILPAASGPIETLSLPSVESYPNAGMQSVDLDTYFTDPDCSQAVRMTYSMGVVDVILYEAATPATVANFLAYVNGSGQGSYDGSIIHRSMPNFVLQGGGYRPIGGSAFESVTDLAPVVNEPGLENVRGTLSMAKLGGDPDSATNEWFVSLSDNRSNLDFQNGGFSVFGRVAGNGMTVIDSIAALPTGNYNSITVDSVLRTSLLATCPMNVETEEAPETMEQDKLVQLLSAAEVAPLAYTIVSNSDASVATASIVDGALQVTPLAAGTCTVRIGVTDLDNHLIERDVTITVGWTFADWIEASGLVVNSGALDDADGDQFSNFLEYNLFGELESRNASLVERSQVSYGTPIAKDYLSVGFSTRLGIEDSVVYVDAINELSANPTWTEVWNSTLGAGDVQVHSSSVSADQIDWVIRDIQAMDASTKRFMRVRAESLPE